VPMAAVEVFRSLHILFAVLWAGAGIFKGVLLPAAAARSGDAGARMRQAYLASGVNGPFMGIAALGTIGFGAAAYGTGGFFERDAGSLAAMRLNLGVLAGLAAFLHGLAGHMPLEKKAAPLAARALAGNLDGADTTLLAGYERRLARADKVSLALIAVALVTMTSYAWFF